MEEIFMKECMTELNEKQVINICDGKILGYVSDFKIDPSDGRLTAIIIPGECNIFMLKKTPDIVIPWEKICKIGVDVILVDIGIFQHNNLECCGNKNHKKR